MRSITWTWQYLTNIKLHLTLSKHRHSTWYPQWLWYLGKKTQAHTCSVLLDQQKAFRRNCFIVYLVPYMKLNYIKFLKAPAMHIQTSYILYRWVLNCTTNFVELQKVNRSQLKKSGNALYISCTMTLSCSVSSGSLPILAKQQESWSCWWPL